MSHVERSIIHCPYLRGSTIGDFTVTVHTRAGDLGLITMEMQLVAMEKLVYARAMCTRSFLLLKSKGLCIYKAITVL